MSIFLFIGITPFNSACSDEYELVLYVRFTTNGEEKFIWSTAFPYIDNTIEISESEYRAWAAALDKQRVLSDKDAFFNGLTLSAMSKTINSYYGLTQEDTGSVLIWSKHFEGTKIYYYGKTTFRGWYYSYVYVKIINNETISIHFGNEENATTYKVTSYQMFYFD